VATKKKAQKGPEPELATMAAPAGAPEFLWVRPSALHPNDWNPNRMDSVTFESLRDGIIQDGFLAPVLIMLDGTIIDGEHRQRACLAIESRGSETWGKYRGTMSAIPLDVTVEQAKKLTIAMDKKRGEFDYGLLSTLMASFEGAAAAGEVRDDLAGYLGFAPAEFERLMAQIDAAPPVGDPMATTPGDVALAAAARQAAAESGNLLSPEKFKCEVRFTSRRAGEEFMARIGVPDPTFRPGTTSKAVDGGKLLVTTERRA